MKNQRMLIKAIQEFKTIMSAAPNDGDDEAMQKFFPNPLLVGNKTEGFQ